MSAAAQPSARAIANKVVRPPCSSTTSPAAPTSHSSDSIPATASPVLAKSLQTLGTGIALASVGVPRQSPRVRIPRSQALIRHQRAQSARQPGTQRSRLPPESPPSAAVALLQVPTAARTHPVLPAPEAGGIEKVAGCDDPDDRDAWVNRLRLQQMWLKVCGDRNHYSKHVAKLSTHLCARDAGSRDKSRRSRGASVRCCSQNPRAEVPESSQRQAALNQDLSILWLCLISQQLEAARIMQGGADRGDALGADAAARGRSGAFGLPGDLRYARIAICIRMCMHVGVCGCMFVCVCVRVYVCMYVRTCVCICVCMHACVYVCMC
jgi:hypothetical protein